MLHEKYLNVELLNVESTKMPPLEKNTLKCLSPNDDFQFPKCKDYLNSQRCKYGKAYGESCSAGSECASGSCPWGTCAKNFLKSNRKR